MLNVLEVSALYVVIKAFKSRFVWTDVGVFSVGAALGPLLAGLISPTGWNNVFYMLISADVLACLVRMTLYIHWLSLFNLLQYNTARLFVITVYFSLNDLNCLNWRWCSLTDTLFVCLQFLARLVYKEAQGWCGRTPRVRGWVFTNHLCSVPNVCLPCYKKTPQCFVISHSFILLFKWVVQHFGKWPCLSQAIRVFPNNSFKQGPL